MVSSSIFQNTVHNSKTLVITAIKLYITCKLHSSLSPFNKKVITKMHITCTTVISHRCFPDVCGEKFNSIKRKKYNMIKYLWKKAEIRDYLMI